MGKAAGFCVGPRRSRGDTSADHAGLLAVATVCIALLALFSCAHASAKEVLKFKEAFGGTEQPVLEDPAGLAVDQSNGDLLVMDRGNATISRYRPDGTADDFPVLGTNVISELPGGEPLSFAGANESQIAVDNSGTATDGDIYVTHSSPPSVDIFARSGEYLGSLTGTSPTSPFGEVCGVSVGPDGSVFVSDYTPGIAKFDPSANPVTPSDFESTIPGSTNRCPSGAAESPANTVFGTYNSPVRKFAVGKGLLYEFSEGPTTTIAMDTETGNVLVASENKVDEWDASGESSATKVTGVTVGSAVQGVAAGPSGLVYVSREGATGIEVFEHVPLPTLSASSPTDLTQTSATLNGSINPRGEAVTECKFEYGPVSGAGFPLTAPCEPSAEELPSASTDLPITAAIDGLQSNESYRFRITAANANGSETSATRTFRAAGPPEITKAQASFATESEATIESTVDPRGFETSYRIMWGPTADYGRVAKEGVIPAGQGPTEIDARISGLQSGSSYHYEVVASSSASSPVRTSDRLFETLNACGLPEGRCFELVSPREPGPVALPGRVESSEPPFQASAAPGSLDYTVESGLPDSTKGALVLYNSLRGATGWSPKPEQISAPLKVQNESSSTASVSGKVLGLSPDLTCGFEASNQPLDPTANINKVTEAGGVALFRRSGNGTYTAVTNLIPSNLDEQREAQPGEAFQVAGFTADCRKVVFSTFYAYPGVPAKRESGTGPYLYEWDNGALRGLGYVPAPGGETLTEAVAGGGGSGRNVRRIANIVSANGNRVFFTATKAEGTIEAEIGKEGVFVREAGATSRDLSLSETTTPDTGARFEFATPDGAHVFFTANTGLTTEANASGTDLYEYDLESDELSDLSISHGSARAEAAAVLGASEDGSRVYFAAQGQLVLNQGPSLEENISSGTYSLYEADRNELTFIGRINETSGLNQGIDSATGRVSPDGRYFLFESAYNVTGYTGGQTPFEVVPEVYLFDAEAQTTPTICVSCRQDGLPSVSGSEALIRPENVNQTHVIRAMVLRNGQPIIFFLSADRMAEGAVEGQYSLYEWSHDQVFKVTTEPPGLQPPPVEKPEGGTNRILRVIEPQIALGDASADGTDVYFTTPSRLTWEDGDERTSVYDARIGGGYPSPHPPAAPCEATREGSCQQPATQVPTTTPPATSGFVGPSNMKAKHHKKKHKKHKKHHKRKHRRKGKKDNRQSIGSSPIQGQQAIRGGGSNNGTMVGRTGK